MDKIKEKPLLYNLLDLRLILTEIYAFSRMFRKFNKKRIINCDNKNSLKNIIYFGGNAHVLNIKGIIDNLLKNKIKRVEAYDKIELLEPNNLKNNNGSDIRGHIHSAKMKSNYYFNQFIDWEKINDKYWLNEI